MFIMLVHTKMHPTEKYSKAGALLRGLRVREGLNQAEFAKIIDTTQANLSSMENGNRPIGKNLMSITITPLTPNTRHTVVSL